MNMGSERRATISNFSNISSNFQIISYGNTWRYSILKLWSLIHTNIQKVTNKYNQSEPVAGE